MEQFFIRLKDMINRQITVYSELFDLSEQEKQAIIKNAVPEVDKIVLRQQIIIKTLKQLEFERAELFSIFSENYGIKKPLLNDIIAHADIDMREELLLLSAKLENVAGELHQLNTLNKKLIETQLSYTSFCINLMSAQSDSMDTYSGSGRLNEKNASRRMLDQSV